MWSGCAARCVWVQTKGVRVIGAQRGTGPAQIAEAADAKSDDGRTKHVDAAAQAAAAAACAEAAARVAEVLVIALHSVVAQNITAAAGHAVCGSGAQRR